MLDDTKKIIKRLPNFYWINKNELKYLISKNNIINMDTLSVFSCAINKKKDDFPINKIGIIFNFINNKKKKYFTNVKKISLYKLKNWTLTNDTIINNKKNYFSIIGLSIRNNSREINKWDQPIIAQENLAFAGFVTKIFNETLHYLVSFDIKPGLKKSYLSCTVRTSDFVNYKTNQDLINFKKNIINQNFINKKDGKLLYKAIQSDEGGRFYKSRICYSVFQFSNNYNLKIPINYIWISHNQMISLIKNKYFDIEARILFACFNLYNENID